MTFPLEYHLPVRQSVSATVALFTLLALPAVFVSTAHAQINGVPSSVTSPGFGGRPVNGTPPSVTSLGPHGYAPNSRIPFSTANRNPSRSPNDDHRRHHHYVEYAPPVVYAVPVPYSVDIGEAEDANDDDDANYQGGPTVFDRRGLGEESYIPPVKRVPRPHATQTDAVLPPGTPQEPTDLIFKDGHKLEVGNYAIVGDTLFDLTPGHARKVALADLDLDATRKQNEDRGVSFQLPPPPRAN